MNYQTEYEKLKVENGYLKKKIDELQAQRQLYMARVIYLRRKIEAYEERLNENSL